MNGGLLAGLHAALWILVYSLAVAAGILAFVVAGRAPRRKPGQAGGWSRPEDPGLASLRALASREFYAVIVISFIYLAAALGLLDAGPLALKRLAAAIANGALLQALGLFALALPPFADFVSGGKDGGREGGEEAGRGRLTRGGSIGQSGMLIATLLGLAFALLTILAAGNPSTRLWLYGGLSCLFLLLAALAASVLASAWRILSPGPRGRGLRALTLLCLASFLASLGIELMPQLFQEGSAASARFYFLFALFFLLLNGGLVAGLLPLALDSFRRGRGQSGAPAQGGPPASPDAALVGAALGAGLSPREAEVAALLAKGAAYKEIAGRLCVSLSTVQTHVARIYEKLGVRNKVELSNRLRP